MMQLHLMSWSVGEIISSNEQRSDVITYVDLLVSGKLSSCTRNVDGDLDIKFCAEMERETTTRPVVI